MQDKISSSLSGWYSEEWGRSIVWDNGNLMVKNFDLGEEIAYNLNEDGITVEVCKNSDPDWKARLIIQ